MTKKKLKPKSRNIGNGANVMSDGNDVMLTTKQLAERWHMDDGTLRNWRAEEPRRGPAFVTLGKKGKGKRPRVLYRLADVEEYERKHMTAAA